MAIKCYSINNQPIAYLTQWDENQQIVIQNISSPTKPSVQATNSRQKKALDCVTSYTGTMLTVNIPNSLLTEPLPLNIYVNKKIGSGSITTIYSIHIPVIPREKPEY